MLERQGIGCGETYNIVKIILYNYFYELHFIKNEIMISTALITISTVLSCIATIVYVILTCKILKESKKSREYFITPEIVAYIESSEVDVNYKYLVFRNIGLGVAKNIKANIIHNDFKESGVEMNNLLYELGIIKAGIGSMYNNQELKYFLLSTKDKDKSILDYKLIVEVSYYNAFGEKYSNEFELKLIEIFGESRTNPPMDKIGRIYHNLDLINKTLEKK